MIQQALRISAVQYRNFAATTKKPSNAQLEQFDLLLNNLNVKLANTQVIPTVKKVSESVITIHNPDMSWKFGEVVQLDHTDKKAVLISLQETLAHALALEDAYEIEVGQTLSRVEENQALADFNGHEVDLKTITSLSKAPFRRHLINKQLYSGHLRIDMQ